MTTYDAMMYLTSFSMTKNSGICLRVRVTQSFVYCLLMYPEEKEVM